MSDTDFTQVTISAKGAPASGKSMLLDALSEMLLPLGAIARSRSATSCIFVMPVGTKQRLDDRLRFKGSSVEKIANAARDEAVSERDRLRDDCAQLRLQLAIAEEQVARLQGYIQRVREVDDNAMPQTSTVTEQSVRRIRPPQEGCSNSMAVSGGEYRPKPKHWTSLGT